MKPVWLDVVNCYADPIFTVPGTGGPGSSFVRTSDFTMPESGRLVSGGAHIHGGGQRLELRNATLLEPRALHLAAQLARRTTRCR